jgi:DSF synthase
MSNLSDTVGLCVPYGRTNSQYETEFDLSSATLWGYFNPAEGAPCFSVPLLRDIAAHEEAFVANGARVQLGAEFHEVSHYVLASRTPGVFSMGGDLGLFAMLVRTRDRDALEAYSRLCIDNVFRRVGNYGSGTLTTISLVQGDALGGGFESALASDVIIAEERAQMGFPEILFNLFPGMGALSLLARRIGLPAAQELILSGRVMSAEQLHRLGVVDVVATDGQGETAVRNWIAKNAKRRNGLQALLRARQFFHPITRQELDGIVALWVDAAMRLGERDLRMMQRLARAQLPMAQPEIEAGVQAHSPAEEPLAAA